MSYSSSISISARHASDLCGVIRLAPSLCRTAPSSSSISCSTKLHQPISALCFENTSAFRFKTSRNFSKSPSPIFPFKCSGSLPCQHCFHCLRVRPHTMPVHHPSQVLNRIPKDFAFRWFALQACSFHTSKDLIEPINVVFQGWCRYDYVIHVLHHEIPVLLGHSGQSLSHQSLKSGRCIAQAEGHPLPLVQSQLARESGFLSILLPQRDLPEGRTQVQCGEELGITKLREALVYSRYRVRIFYRYRVQLAKVATKS